MATSEEECPVCRDKIRDPTEPSQCCGKVICQRCLRQSLQYRAHCPHCRSQVTNPLCPAVDRRRFRLLILPGNSATFNTERRVGTNIQSLINQLQDIEAAQTNTANQANLPNQNVPPPVPPPVLPRQARPFSTGHTFPPIPVPRVRAQPAITATQPATGNAFSRLLAQLAQLNPTPAQENLDAELDEWPSQTEIMEMEQQERIQGFGEHLRTFVCPYCQKGGLDDLDLLDHCNTEHANDSKRVVCPVCVALPHGDPQYYSRNFIGHLNLRHCYYIGDITNVCQSDEINLQCAIMASCAQNF